MPQLILGIALTVGGLLLLRGFLTAEPRVLARALRWTGIALLVLLAAGLIESGRGGLLITLLAMAAAPLLRLALRRRAAGGADPVPGRRSSLRTRFLDMSLDHDSGALSGEVLEGGFRGRALDGLTLDEALDLLEECRRGDPQSATVLETWLDRARGPDWRGRAERPSAAAPPPAAGPMTRDEALAILGLEPGATPDAVREAHRRLMGKLHPDHGGSTWIAAKLNQARDILTPARE